MQGPLTDPFGMSFCSLATTCTIAVIASAVTLAITVTCGSSIAIYPITIALGVIIICIQVHSGC